jgi:lactoylglutathione lyase
MQSLITGIAHVGIRVAELERSRQFYALLGFELVAGPLGSEPVAILEHAAGIEINLILNAQRERQHNVLMEEPVKHAGYTHIALGCRDIEAARASLEAAGIAISGGPVTFPNGHRAIFVRDPDRNVIELHQAIEPSQTSA